MDKQYFLPATTDLRNVRRAFSTCLHFSVNAGAWPTSRPLFFCDWCPPGPAKPRKPEKLQTRFWRQHTLCRDIKYYIPTGLALGTYRHTPVTPVPLCIFSCSLRSTRYGTDMGERGRGEEQPRTDTEYLTNLSTGGGNYLNIQNFSCRPVVLLQFPHFFYQSYKSMSSLLFLSTPCIPCYGRHSYYVSVSSCSKFIVRTF
jgi:hypothetical protein